MAYNFEEQDQIDDLKAFWNKYGNFILTVVTVIALSVAGYRLWGWYQHKTAGEAAGAYAVLQEAARDKDMARVTGASQTLFDEYGSSILAPMGALVAAKTYFEANELDKAADALRWVIDNAADSEFAPIARVRLAGVLLDQNKAEDGLAVLDAGAPPEAFKVMVHDRRGDLLVALGRNKDAIAEYEAALDSIGTARGPQGSIRLKLAALKTGS